MVRYGTGYLSVPDYAYGINFTGRVWDYTDWEKDCTDWSAEDADLNMDPASVPSHQAKAKVTTKKDRIEVFYRG